MDVLADITDITIEEDADLVFADDTDELVDLHTVKIRFGKFYAFPERADRHASLFNEFSERLVTERVVVMIKYHCDPPVFYYCTAQSDSSQLFSAE